MSKRMEIQNELDCFSFTFLYQKHFAFAVIINKTMIVGAFANLYVGGTSNDSVKKRQERRERATETGSQHNIKLEKRLLYKSLCHTHTRTTATLASVRNGTKNKQ